MSGKTRESGLTEIMALMCILATCYQDPAFLHPESPQGARSGSCSGCWFHGPDILCFLIQWAIPQSLQSEDSLTLRLFELDFTNNFPLLMICWYSSLCMKFLAWSLFNSLVQVLLSFVSCSLSPRASIFPSSSLLQHLPQHMGSTPASLDLAHPSCLPCQHQPATF